MIIKNGTPDSSHGSTVSGWPGDQVKSEPIQKRKMIRKTVWDAATATVYIRRIWRILGSSGLYYGRRSVEALHPFMSGSTVARRIWTAVHIDILNQFEKKMAYNPYPLET